jgi:biotin carboxyl carrier protein
MSEKTKKTEIKSTGTEKTTSETSGLHYETFVVNGASYLTLLTKKYKNRKKWEPKNEKLVVSFIPGTILKVLVKEKEKVQKDQPLILLEAMKMENTMFAPFAATVKKIHIKTGDKVSKGFLLLEFE